MRYTCCLLLSLICFKSFAQADYIIHKPYARQYFYLDSLRLKFSNLSEQEESDKFKELEKQAAIKGDEHFADELALREIRWMPSKQVAELSESRMVDIKMRAESRKDHYLEADALQSLGDYWSDKRKYGRAFENYLAAYTIYSKFTAEEFPPKRQYLYNLGGAYYHYDDNENAIKYLQEALQTQSYTSLYSPSLNNTIGLCYRKMAKYDSSEWYFRKVYNEALTRNDSAWIGIASGNMGINYFQQKKYAEAIPLLQKDIDLSLATHNIRNAARSMNVMAQICYFNKEYDKSEQLLRKALSVLEDKSFWPEYSLAEPIFSLLSKVYAAKKDMQKAYLYADSAITAKDSVESQHSVLSYAKAKEKIDYMQHKLETEQLTNQKKLQELIRDGLIAAILLLTVIAILFINRQRIKQKKLEVEKKNAEAELGLAAVQLDSFRQSVQEKNAIIERFTNELEKVKAGMAEEETDTDVLTQLQNAIILTDEQWEHFRALFEKVHKNFFVNLKQKIPDLSQAEIRFLALTKLKLSSKEMAAMLGISANAIRIYRHRIRRKLSLDKEDAIEELVNNI